MKKVFLYSSSQFFFLALIIIKTKYWLKREKNNKQIKNTKNPNLSSNLTKQKEKKESNHLNNLTHQIEKSRLFKKP